MSDEWTREIVGWVGLLLFVTVMALSVYFSYSKDEEDERALSERCAVTCAPYASHGNIGVEGKPYCVCSNVDENVILKKAKCPKEAK